MTNKLFFSLLPLLLLVLMPITPTGLRAQNAAPATIAIEPATIEIPVGKTVEVAVRVRDVLQLYGFDISLAFNPQAFEVVDADPNSDGVQVGFGTFLDSGFALRNQVDNSTGTIHFAMTQVNPSEPKNGEGVLMVLTLRGKEVGVPAELSVTNAELGQPRGITLESAISPVPTEIKIVEGAASFSPEPIPTQDVTNPGLTGSEEIVPEFEIKWWLIITGSVVLLLLLMILLVGRELRRKG